MSAPRPGFEYGKQCPVQDISKVLPLTYASSALRKVMVLGAGILDITTELTILIAFGAVMTAIAVPVFRRMMTR